MQATKGKSSGERTRKAETGRRERLLSRVLDLVTDLRYSYKVDASGDLLTEWTEGEIAGSPNPLPPRAPVDGFWLGLAHPDDAAILRAHHQRLLDGAPSIDEFRVVIPSGTRWLRVYSQPEWDARKGRVVRIVGAARDISDYKDAERARRENEQRFRDIIESSDDWVWETDAEHCFTFFSQRLMELTGVTDGYWLGKRRVDIVAATVPPSDLAAHLEDLAAHRPFRFFTYWTEGPMGRRCFSISGKPVFDEAGRFRGYRGTGTDVTAQKQAEERQALLLAELDHRVKNTLAVVGSLLRQTRRGSRSPEEFETAFTGRIYAMARAHSLLTQNRWAGTALRDLVAQVLAPYQERGSRLRVHGGDRVRLKPQTAVTVSMTLHELATNAVKYGALSAPAGQVDIGWRVEMGETPPRLILSWRESGGPPVTAPARRGFGSTLIERGVTYELDGRVTLDFAPQGVCCELEIPLTPETGSRIRRKSS